MQLMLTGAPGWKVSPHKQLGVALLGQLAFRSMTHRTGRPRPSNPTKILLSAWAGAEGSLPRKMVTVMQTDPELEPETTVRSVTVEASSTHPEDWGRATALALSQLIQEIIATTGTDPCRDPEGLNVSLHIKAVPEGEAITVSWRG